MNMYYIIFMMILRDFALLGMRPKCLSLLASLLSKRAFSVPMPVMAPQATGRPAHSGSQS